MKAVEYGEVIFGDIFVLVGGGENDTSRTQHKQCMLKGCISSHRSPGYGEEKPGAIRKGVWWC